MFSYLFTFRSQTAAQSGRRILYEAGLWTQLRRAPQEVSSLGCTWGVYVEGADGVHAAQLLRAWRADARRARVSPCGTWRSAPQGQQRAASGAWWLRRPGRS